MSVKTEKSKITGVRVTTGTLERLHNLFPYMCRFNEDLNDLIVKLLDDAEKKYKVKVNV